MTDDDDGVLDMFEGAPVVEAVIALTSPAEGLREAQAVQQLLIRRGTRLRLVVEVTASKVEHKAIDKDLVADEDAPLVRKVTLEASMFRILEVGEEARVDQLLADQRERVLAYRRREADRKTGQTVLAGTDG